MPALSSNAVKILAVLAALLGLTLAFFGYRYSREYAQSSQKVQQAVVAPAAQAAPKVLAVVAVNPLPAYQPIAKEAVQLVEVAIAPKDYYTSVDQVIGKSPLTDIDGGAPITQRYFAEGNILAKTIPAGFQAVSVEISDVIGVGGFVRPGDIVDVLLYLRSGNEVQDIQARVLLKQTRVLAYQELLVDRPEGLKDEEQSGRVNANQRRQRTAVLAVPQGLTTRLMLGASMGELRLALHGFAPENTELATLPGDPTAVASGLPLSAEAQRKDADKTPPDNVITAEQLSRVEPAAAQKKTLRREVYVYRGSTVETVTP